MVFIEKAECHIMHLLVGILVSQVYVIEDAQYALEHSTSD